MENWGTKKRRHLKHHATGECWKLNELTEYEMPFLLLKRNCKREKFTEEIDQMIDKVGGAY